MEIEAFLKQSSVLMGNTHNVCDKRTLLNEFDKLSGAKSIFVALTVDHFEDHKWVVRRYGVEQDRGGGCSLGGLPIQIWEVTLHLHKFLVFGALKRVHRGRIFVKMCLLQVMIEQKLLEIYEHKDTYLNKVEVTRPEQRQYEPLPMTKAEMDREWQKGFQRLVGTPDWETTDPDPNEVSPWTVMRCP